MEDSSGFDLYLRVNEAITSGDITPEQAYRIILCLMVDLFNRWDAPDDVKERVLRDAPGIAMSHVGDPPEALLH